MAKAGEGLFKKYIPKDIHEKVGCLVGPPFLIFFLSMTIMRRNLVIRGNATRRRKPTVPCVARGSLDKSASLVVHGLLQT